MPGDTPQNAKALAAEKMTKVCLLPEDEAVKLVEGNSSGLSSETAAGRLSEFGENVLARKHGDNVVLDILERFKNPLAIQLLVICAISALMSDYRSAIVVGFMARYGCDALQGYLMSRPIPADELETLLAKRKQGLPLE